MLPGRDREPHGSCPCRTDQRHNARCPAFEVRITYPFHPRHGELVSVVRRQRHGGADHFVIRQPDTTLALLPTWMTQEDAMRSAALIAHPRLAPDALRALRALVDSLLGSADGDSPRREGAGHGKLSRLSTRSIRTVVEGRGLTDRCADETATAAARPFDGSCEHGCGDRGRGRGDR